MTYMMKESAQDLSWADIGSMTLDVEEAFKTEPEPLDFVLPGLLAGSAGLLIAAGGVGKSMFLLQNAMSIAAGADMFRLWSLDGDAEIKQGKVVIVAVEDPVLILRHRVHCLGKHLTPEQRAAVAANLYIIPGFGRGFSIAEQADGGLRAAEPLRQLRWWLKSLNVAPRLVAYDTLNRCLGGANENNASDMGLVMSFVEATCLEHGCASLIVHHANKASVTSGTSQEQSASRGSSAITSNGRWQANMSVMSVRSAEKRGINDDRERRCWVQCDIPKINYSAPEATRWLYRGEEGALRGEVPPPEIEDMPAAPKGRARKQPPIVLSDDDAGW